MKYLALLSLCLFFAVATGWAIPSGTILTGAHGDQQVLPKTCRACHRGMKMTIRNEEKTCLACHGNASSRGQMEASGYLRSGGTRLLDIEVELRKPYNHPVLTVSGVHQRNEMLPETQVNAMRHAECVDCHNPHQADREMPYRGLKGKRVGNFMADLTEEYELCYKCHGSSANLPTGFSDKQAEFRPLNKSYHPVEREGANAHVISLIEPYVARKERPGDISMISCRDCHGSDNPNAPRGPHGSTFRGLLVANYEMQDGRPESAYAYALCYRCHSRSSILSNESFPYHSRHILGDQSGTRPGTSCLTCHDAHGSSANPYLIQFNPDLVKPNQAGQLRFRAQGVATRHGSCALSCHGVDHGPKEY